jgi:hypothetical protein
MSLSNQSLGPNPGYSHNARPSEVETLASLLKLDNQDALEDSIVSTCSSIPIISLIYLLQLDAVRKRYDLDTHRSQPRERMDGLEISHHSLTSALVTAVTGPRTKHRSTAQRKVVQKDGLVMAGHAALKLAKGTEDAGRIHKAEGELEWAAEESAHAWTALARYTLADVKAWGKTLAKLEGGPSGDGETGTTVSVWK